MSDETLLALKSLGKLGLIAKRFWKFLLPVLPFLILPMCSMGSITTDSTNPPYTEQEIRIFQDISTEKEVFFVDLMIYHYTIDQGDITYTNIRNIAKKFKYTVEGKVPIVDENGNPVLDENGQIAYETEKDENGNVKVDSSGKPIYKTQEEERTYTLDEVLNKTSMTSEEIEAALALAATWSIKFGETSIIRDLPEGYVVPNSNFIWPTPGLDAVTSLYGPRWGAFHYGVDIAGQNAFGSPVVATASGTVKEVKYVPGAPAGMYITISHDDGYQSRYLHLSAVNVIKGQKVEKGQVIGGVGNTGRSTGPHLHFELSRNGRIFDPLPYIASTMP